MTEELAISTEQSNHVQPPPEPKGNILNCRQNLKFDILQYTDKHTHVTWTAAALVFSLSQPQHLPSTFPVHFQAFLPTSWPSPLPHSSQAASRMSCPASCQLEVLCVTITLAGCLDSVACSFAMVCSMTNRTR